MFNEEIEEGGRVEVEFDRRVTTSGDAVRRRTNSSARTRKRRISRPASFPQFYESSKNVLNT